MPCALNAACSLRDEHVLHQRLIGMRPGAQLHRAAQAHVAEAAEADVRLEGGDGAFAGPLHVAGHGKDQRFHGLGVAGIADHEVHRGVDLGRGQAVIGDDGLGQLDVRHDGGARGDLEQGGAPVEIHHPALEPRVHLDEIADPDLAGHGDEQAGEQIRQRLLHRQGHRQAAHPQGGQHRPDLDAQPVQHHQQAERDDHQPDDVLGQRRDRGAGRRTSPVGHHETRGHGGRRLGHRQDAERVDRERDQAGASAR